MNTPDHYKIKQNCGRTWVKLVGRNFSQTPTLIKIDISSVMQEFYLVIKVMPHVIKARVKGMKALTSPNFTLQRLSFTTKGYQMNC